jgi:hypothetical protein
MENKKRYFKCDICNFVTFTTNNKYPDYICLSIAQYMIGGICGGEFTIEINESEFNDHNN